MGAARQFRRRLRRPHRPPGTGRRAAVTETVPTVVIGERALVSPPVSEVLTRLRRSDHSDEPRRLAGQYAKRMQVPAFRSARVRWAVAGVAALVLAADQVSKSLVLAAHPGTGSGPVTVRLVRNTGASFGIGAGHPILITLVAAVVIAVVVGLLARTPSRIAALLLAVVLGGALGNLADRLFRSPGLGGGAVIDWIHVQGYPATFNIADVAIRVGGVAAAAVMLGGWARIGRWLSARRGAP